MTFRQKIEKARKLMKTYIEKYPKNGIACSFGKDSMVLMHLARGIKADIFTFGVMSDTEFPETIKFKDRVITKWKLNYKEYTYKNDPKKGLKDCCRSKKVKIFKKAVRDLDVWFSGIRRDEGLTRVSFKYVEKKGGLIKINPILDFTEKDIWRYCAIYSIPVNPLYKSYRSLSCKKCSVKEMSENDSERAGRWFGTTYQGAECGIHTQSLR